eukprot:GFUD01094533.1.p1 GENE.GFUD01094533.1~~GFUD01094533.1.p1  ORF type:complete len:195 (+),score=49.27 GFUD01094533.1:48-587(+)
MSIKGSTSYESEEEDGVQINGKPLWAPNSDHTKKRGKKRNSEHISIDTELEELMSFEPKPPKYKSLPKVISTNTIKSLKCSGLPEKVTLMFLRMDDEEVFLPVHLTPVTYNNLDNTLTTKFAALKDKKIKRIMQKTKSGITFVLDESMVEYIENRTVFVMDAQTDEEGLTSVTMREQTI